jgi:2',3'-cyclic-nucleotide 2'-phosphodiesterase (5'-nucleotidase family)
LTRTGLALCAAVAICCADKPDVGAHSGSQSAADALREFASADGAFLAAGLVKEEFKRDDLASILQYPTDEVVVLSLSGSQIRQALERSVSLHPQPNMSFLQISGFEVTFSPTAAPGSRIVSVSVGGSPLADGRTYTVAMPSSLGRGGLGYFKIWDKAKIVKTYEGSTVEGVLKGKRFSETSSRWTAQG